MALKLDRQYRWRKRIGSVTRKTAIPVANALILTAVGAPQSVVVTFDQPVVLSGVPTSWSIIGGAAAGENPTAAVLTADDEVTLTFLGDATAATGLAVPPYDPAIRTKSGGYASPDAFTI